MLSAMVSFIFQLATKYLIIKSKVKNHGSTQLTMTQSSCHPELIEGFDFALLKLPRFLRPLEQGFCLGETVHFLLVAKQHDRECFPLGSLHIDGKIIS